MRAGARQRASSSALLAGLPLDQINKIMQEDYVASVAIDDNDPEGPACGSDAIAASLAMPAREESSSIEAPVGPYESTQSFQDGVLASHEVDLPGADEMRASQELTRPTDPLRGPASSSRSSDNEGTDVKGVGAGAAGSPENEGSAHESDGEYNDDSFEVCGRTAPQGTCVLWTGEGEMVRLLHAMLLRRTAVGRDETRV